MTEAKNEFGVVRLGRMGGNLALQALESDMRVVGSKNKGAPDEMLGAGLVVDALHMEVSVPIISQSVMQLFASRDDEKNWTRSIAMMRHGFGRHAYRANEGATRERRKGRIGGFLNE